MITRIIFATGLWCITAIALLTFTVSVVFFLSPKLQKKHGIEGSEAFGVLVAAIVVGFLTCGGASWILGL